MATRMERGSRDAAAWVGSSAYFAQARHALARPPTQRDNTRCIARTFDLENRRARRALGRRASRSRRFDRQAVAAFRVTVTRVRVGRWWGPSAQARVVGTGGFHHRFGTTRDHPRSGAGIAGELPSGPQKVFPHARLSQAEVGTGGAPSPPAASEHLLCRCPSSTDNPSGDVAPAATRPGGRRR